MALTDEGMVMPVAPTGGSNNFGGDGWWILLLLLFAGGFGGMGGNNNIYPWMNQADVTTSGFQNAALNTAVSGIQSSITSGFGDMQTALCGGFAGVNASITNASINSMQNANAIQNLVQSEGSATRVAIERQTNAILDKLCQQEIDALKSKNIELQNQVLVQNLNASQVAQTAQLIADNTAQTQYIVNRVAPYPVPSYTVANPLTPATLI